MYYGNSTCKYFSVSILQGNILQFTYIWILCLKYKKNVIQLWCDMIIVVITSVNDDDDNSIR